MSDASHTLPTEFDTGGLFDPSKVSAYVRISAFLPTEVSGQRVRGTLRLGPAQHTPWGIVHGGVLASAVESAASLGATAAVAPRGQLAVGVSNTTDFLAPVVGGLISVEATALQQGARHQLWQVRLEQSDTGTLVALGSLRLENISVRRRTAG